MPHESASENCYVALTHDVLDVKAIMDRVRSPKAGAIVLFAGKHSNRYKLTYVVTALPFTSAKPNIAPGTTRDNFDSKPVISLTYTSYAPRALKSMLSICQIVASKHSVTSIAMIHRLGPVPVIEESILIAVSTPHRKAAWLAGEEALELCKEKVEVWKLEEFGGGEGVWRANRDGKAGVPHQPKEKGNMAEVSMRGGAGEGDADEDDGNEERIGNIDVKSLDETKPLDGHQPFDSVAGKQPVNMPRKDGDGGVAPSEDKTKTRSMFEHGHGPVDHKERGPTHVAENLGVKSSNEIKPLGGGQPVFTNDGKPACSMPNDAKIGPSGDMSKSRSMFEHGHGPVKHVEREE